MIVFGAGGFLAGRVVHSVLARWPIAAVLRTVLLVIAGLLAVLTVLTITHVSTVARVVEFPLLFAFGAAWWSGGISQQTRLAGLAPQQRSQALGLHFSAQFLGVAIGGALGGLALSAVSAGAVPVVGGLVALATLVSVRQTMPAPAAAASAAERTETAAGSPTQVR
jgi:predicted MFS family arabinose efflux permease